MGSPPIPPSIHPLEGNRRIFLADGCLYRYQELSFTRYFSNQHGHPGAVIREGDPCLWNFEGISGKEDVYRIFCADPNFPELHQHNLTYTRFQEDGVPQDDHNPFITLRDRDYCEWKIRKAGPKDQYEIYCLSGNGPFKDASLAWTDEQEDLEAKLTRANKKGCSDAYPRSTLTTARAQYMERRQKNADMVSKAKAGTEQERRARACGGAARAAGPGRREGRERRQGRLGAPRQPRRRRTPPSARGGPW